MKFYKHIYLCKKAKNFKEIKRGFKARTLYAVCFNQNSKNIFDIWRYNELLKTKNNYLVIAILESKESAFLFVTQVFENYLAQNGSLKGIRDFYDLYCR